MAIFHLSAQVISRSTGRSSVAACAYRLGISIEDERTGLTHDYTKRSGVDSFQTLAPDDAPEWVHDPARLWNEVEKAEKRKDAQVCREVNFALPKELTPEQQKALAVGYIKEQMVARGMVACVAFHDLDSDNPHCHVMLTMREVGPEGFGKKVREWNDRQVIDEWRQGWETHANRALEAAGHDARIDHRSLEAQGIEREPQQHMGPAACEMEKRGITPDRQRIMPVPASMDHERAKEERRREQVDAPKSREAMEREDKEKRQKQEREASWAVVVEAKATQQVRLKQAQAVGENWQVAKVAGENATKAAEGACVEIAGWKKRAIEKREIVEQWEAKHPIRNFLGFRGADVTKAENQATQADENAKLAEKSRVEAKAAKVKAEEQMKVLHEQAVEHRLAAEKDQATRTEAEKDHSALIRRHQRENYTPAQVKQEALQRAADEKWETEWLEKQVQSIEARKRPQGPQQQQEQQHTRKGPQLKPDWGQSL